MLSKEEADRLEAPQIEVPSFNVALLREVQECIRKEPKSFYMGWWYIETSCGTTACIAGHVLIASGLNPNHFDPQGTAAKLLRITWDQAHRLFHSINWPRPFYTNDSTLKTINRDVPNAIARIDHFINTNGRE